MVPNVTILSVLSNPNFPDAQEQLREVQEAAGATGQRLHIRNASNTEEIDSAFETFVQVRPGALLVGTDPFFISRREQITTLAARQGIPAMYGERDFSVAGGLMSYGASFPDAVRQVGKLRRESSQRRKASRFTGPATDQVRVSDQSQNGEGTRPNCAHPRCSRVPTR